MSARRIVPVLALALASFAPTLAWAAPTAHAGCAFREHQVTSVKAYKVEERIGRGSIHRLRGAEVYVKAEQGLTAQWLQLTLQEHIARMNSAAKGACALGVSDVRVDVRPAGAGFAVRLIAKDPARAEEVLHRAEALVR
jgi:hypothetical protein